MVVAARAVGLPDLDHRVGHYIPCPVVDCALDPHGLGVIRRNKLRAVLVEERVVEKGADRLGGCRLVAHVPLSTGVSSLPSSTMSNLYPRAHSGSVASRSNEDIKRLRASASGTDRK